MQQAQGQQSQGQQQEQVQGQQGHQKQQEQTQKQHEKEQSQVEPLSRQPHRHGRDVEGAGPGLEITVIFPIKIIT